MEIALTAVTIVFFAPTWDLVRAQRSSPCGHRRRRKSNERALLLGLVVTVLLTVYLFFALLKPERF